jgi:hypothetical protein
LRQRVGQRREINVRQRINQAIVPRNADLDEAKFFEIAVKTVGLGIDRDAIDGSESWKQLG